MDHYVVINQIGSNKSPRPGNPYVDLGRSEFDLLPAYLERNSHLGLDAEWTQMKTATLVRPASI